MRRFPQIPAYEYRDVKVAKPKPVNLDDMAKAEWRAPGGARARTFAEEQLKMLS